MGLEHARGQSLSLLLRRSARRHRSKTALICGSERLSYADLDILVDSLANGLLREGVKPGERIAVLARNSHAFVAIRFAVARTGAVLVPINFMLGEEEVRYILEHSGASMLFVDASTATTGCAAAPQNALIFGLPGEHTAIPDEQGVRSWKTLMIPAGPVEDPVNSQDLLQIIYTSGTESRPKGAMLTHEAVLWEYQSCIVDCEWTASTVVLHALPLFHCAQLDCMMGPALAVGATNVVTSSSDPERILPLMGCHGVTSFFAPPTVWIALLASPMFTEHDLSTLEKGYYGASIMPVEVLEDIRRKLPRVRLWNLYGQTEIAPVATILLPEEHAERLGSAGRPTLHVETRIVDDAMNDVAVGQVGEIVHRSPQLLTGYWRDEQRTAEAFAGGWFHSGDLGMMDAEGYITVVDRKKDMIKSGGENVASREVEEVIYAHPAVLEAAVVGMPDPKWIEMVTAFVVVRPDHNLDEEALLAHCRKKLAGFKCPKRILFLDRLPRSASGKILKRELRERDA